MTEYWYAVRVNPQPWEVGPLGIGRKNGKLRPYVGPSPQLEAYKNDLRDQLADQRPVKVDGKVELRFYFWRRIDEYTTKAGRTQSSHIADATNLQKATEDAIQDLLIGNDRDVVSPKSVIVEQGKDVDPLVIICVKPAGYYDHEIPDFVRDKIPVVADTDTPPIQSVAHVNPEDWF